MNKTIPYLVGLGITAIVVLFLFTFIVAWEKVDGSERLVWQGYSGVYDKLAEDGMHWYLPLVTKAHRYCIASKRFVIDDKVIHPENDYITDEERRVNQPDMEPLSVPVQMDYLTPDDIVNGKTTGPTDVIVRCSMQYHLDPTYLVKLHKEKTKNYEHSFVSDIIREAIISNTTILDARTVYQGSGRVALQRKIEEVLKSNPRFAKYGIIVENFVIREINLKDTDFLQKITAEARAEQDRKTAEKEKIAHDAKALAEQSKAMAEQKRRLVEAATKKGEQIAQAEAAKQQAILGAEASAAQVKEQARLEGEGIRLKKVAEAEGVLALGKAEAESQKLKLLAYQGEGGERFAEVEKAKAFSKAFNHVQYIPSDMKLMSISRDFMDGLKTVLPATRQ